MKANKVLLLPLIVSIMLNNKMMGQPNFNIAVKVNDQTKECVVYHNEPIFISVNLHNPNSFSDWSWNRKADQWISELKKEYEKGKITQAVYEEEVHKADSLKRIIKIDSIGSPGNPWTAQLRFVASLKIDSEVISLPVNHFSLPQDQPIAISSQHNYNFARFGISPADVKRLKAAVYLLKVKLDSVESNDLMLTVNESDLPASVMNSETMLLRFGRYYFYTNELELAFGYAEQIIKAYPHSIGGWTLRGDTRIKMKLYRDALKDFKKVLEEINTQFPGSGELPLNVLATIDWLKQQLNIKN